MAQEDIYRVLLELKENSGKTNAKLDDIKEALVEQSIKHDKLEERHEELRSSHDSYKSKILFVSGGVGAFFGGLATWFYKTFMS